MQILLTKSAAKKLADFRESGAWPSWTSHLPGPMGSTYRLGLRLSKIQY
jgi:hypothetical protein